MKAETVLGISKLESLWSWGGILFTGLAPQAQLRWQDDARNRGLSPRRPTGVRRVAAGIRDESSPEGLPFDRTATQCQHLG